MSSSLSSKWSVLLLSPGHGYETLRSIIVDYVSSLGFNINVYDHPGYPIDPSLHAHVNCMKAISSHDIILAFADENEGSEFNISELSGELLEWLQSHNILKRGIDPSQQAFTIFQMEVMISRALNKPTIVFIPRTTQARVDEEIRLLQSGSLKLKPRTVSTTDPALLIQHSNWSELNAQYDVPTGKISTFRQVVFLEALRNETPNFISYYDRGNIEQLNREVRSRLSGIAEILIKEHFDFISTRIEKKRNPIGTYSLQDLINQGQIILPPFRVLSGTFNGPLFSVGEMEEGILARSIIDGKNILLLGSPGLGKTTACLLAYRDIAQESKTFVEGFAPLYASWRDLPSIPVIDSNKDSKNYFEYFIRSLLSIYRNREPWPFSLELPQKRWILVLDGLDESSLDSATIIKILEKISKSATLLLSCRVYDYERHLQQSKYYFNIVLELVPWEFSNILSFVKALHDSGKERASHFIKRIMDEGMLSDFISIPLWLSMLTYLAEKASPEFPRDYKLLIDDYEVLRICSDALAEDQIQHYSIVDGDIQKLRYSWENAAWILHVSRREKRSVRLDDMEAKLSIKENSSFGKAIFTFLDTLEKNIRGFFHEVFQEYWLAEFLVDRLVDNDSPPLEVAKYFSYQRSVVTNRLIRQRIKSREDIVKISNKLRLSFGEASSLGERSEFAKNQIVYLMGRVDNSQDVKDFLKKIWRSDLETPFVKYSAAFAAVLLGDPGIEDEYFNLVKNSDEDDRINRGYHLYYYGDIDISETSMPPLDDNVTSASATLRQLIKRQARMDDRQRFARRIELFTIRRFLETGRSFPKDITNQVNVLNSVVEDAKKQVKDEKIIQTIEDEVSRILQLIKAN